jgi:hypothetical protein
VRLRHGPGSAHAATKEKPDATALALEFENAIICP